MLLGVQRVLGHNDHLDLIGQHGSGLRKSRCGEQNEEDDEGGFHSV
jgi:hypothetical protein